MATFGNTASNQSSPSNATRVMVSYAVAPSSGTVQSAVARLWLTNPGSTSAKFAIYADNGSGGPGALLAESDVVTVDTTTAQTEHVFTFSGSNQIQIQQEVTYWIGPCWLDADPNGSSNQVNFGRTSGGERIEQNFNWPNLPTNFGTPADVNAGPIYGVVTYTERASTETKRLYLSSLPATYRRPASAWVTDDTAATENVRRLTESAAGDPMQYSRPETASDNSPWVLLGMWVSEPLTTASVIYPEATLCAAMWESSGSANMYPFAVVSVTQGDSAGLFRGSPLSHYNSTRELPTTPSGYQFDLTVVDSGPVQAEVGDRIVIQVGYKPENTSTTEYTGSIAFGGVSNTDLVDEETNLNYPPWIDITVSEGTEFQPVPTGTHKFYLANAPATVEGPGGVYPLWLNGAIPEAYDEPLLLSRTPQGESNYREYTETSTSTEFRAALTQFISPPASAEGAIYGDVEMVVARQAQPSGGDLYAAFTVWVYTGDPYDPIRGDGYGFISNDSMPTTAAGDAIANTIRGLNIQPGDRIVVEIGYQAENSVSTPYTGRIYFGGESSTDLSGDDTNMDHPGWIELRVTEGVTFEEEEDTSTPPGSVFDLSRWHLTTPADGGDGVAEQINQPELDSYASEYFFLDAQGRMAMLAPVDGYTTSGESGATRCEFRERDLPGYTLSAWSIYDRQGRTLTVSGYFDPTSIQGGSNPRKEMIIGQIHGDLGSPPIYLAAEYHVATPRIRLFKYNGSNSAGVDNLVVGIEPGDLITYRIEYVPGENPTDPEEPTGRLNVYAVAGGVDDLPGTPQYSYAPADFFGQDTNWYFKFGAYNKTQIGAADSGRSEARITFAELLVDDVPVFTTRFFFAG